MHQSKERNDPIPNQLAKAEYCNLWTCTGISLAMSWWIIGKNGGQFLSSTGTPAEMQCRKNQISIQESKQNYSQRYEHHLDLISWLTTGNSIFPALNFLENMTHQFYFYLGQVYIFLKTILHELMCWDQVHDKCQIYLISISRIRKQKTYTLHISYSVRLNAVYNMS